MLLFRKTLEQDIEDTIAALEHELALLAPLPEATRAYTLVQRNVITGAFNKTANLTMEAYLRDLPRRQGIERQIAYYRRRLHALALHRAYAGDFILAA